MDFIVGSESDGTVVLANRARILYLRAGALGTEIYLDTGQVLRVTESPEGLGIGIFSQETATEQQTVGVAPQEGA
jgi:hypothetical protein